MLSSQRGQKNVMTRLSDNIQHHLTPASHTAAAAAAAIAASVSLEVRFISTQGGS